MSRRARKNSEKYKFSMNIDLEKLLDICINKINRGMSIESIKRDVLSRQNEEVWSQLSEKLALHSNRKRNINYWILLCNPLTWYEGTDIYQVNDLLLNLDEEFWKINGKSVYPNIQIGDKGIIKVGEDNRSSIDRMDNNDNEVEKLDAGIYATFEVVKNEDKNSHIKKVEFLANVESFVYIKIINNFFKENKIIPKENAIKLLGKKDFQTRSSKKINEVKYRRIENIFKN